MITADSIDAALCTISGVTHDYRPRTYQFYPGAPDHTSWVCIWCEAVACGNYSDPDPCWKPHHHSDSHMSRAGTRWPLGGNR